MTTHMFRHQGLFVGLTTLDSIYRVPAPPQSNQKLVASEYVMAAGGPATNAAIAFQSLSRQTAQQHQHPHRPSSEQRSNLQATLLSVIGSHPLGQMVQTEVKQWDVAIADLNPSHSEPVPTSSIMVTAATGERAVVSLNAVKCVATPDQISPSISAQWDEIGVVLIDGHQMVVGEAIARRARQTDIPVVIDAGSWKAGFEHVLPYATYVICSDNFRPPACTTTTEVHQFLKDLGVPHIAITHGANPIDYWNHCNRTSARAKSDRPHKISVPEITPIDTLGAGDIFHGAFCYYLLESLLTTKEPEGCSGFQTQSVAAPIQASPQTDISNVLEKAAQVASKSCTFFGSRAWMGIV